MKNLFWVPIIAMVVAACDKTETTPTQRLDLLCGEYRVDAAIYPDRTELGIVRIRDENHPTWAEAHTWLAKQIPHIDDTLSITLPITDAENKYNNGMGQIEFAMRRDKLTNTTKIWFGSYVQNYDKNPQLNGKINSWDICTPAIQWHGAVQQPDDAAHLNAETKRYVQNCIAEIRKMRPLIHGDKMRLLNRDGDAVTRRTDIIDSIIGADDADGRSKYYIYRYQNDDGVIHEYETDACDVAMRLRNFINKKRK